VLDNELARGVLLPQMKPLRNGPGAIRA
jgi:hypothetical protein